MIILTNKTLNSEKINNAQVIKLSSSKELDNYNNNSDVVAICGSRAMAIQAEKLNFPSLKLFQLTSAGFDGVPLNSYTKKGISVANAGSVYSVPIAETVIFGILQMAKRIRKNPNNRLFKLTRHYNTITELKDKNILILGAGNIGTAIAERLAGFEMCIDAYDPFCAEKVQYNKIFRSLDLLLSHLGKYDYIVSTLPDNEQTRNLIDKSFLSRLNKNAVIINVGRKTVYNEKELYNVLKKKSISGAVLDIFEVLPNPITNKFRRLSNVIVWPGLAATSKELNIRLTEHMINNVKAVLEDGKISSIIN